MTDTVQHHCTRSRWKRPTVWVLGIAAVLLVVFSFVGDAGRPPAVSYSAFLDQLNAANVTSVVWFGSQTPTILVILGAIIFAKPMLLVFGGLVVAGAERAMGGRKKEPQQSTVPSNSTSMHPMHGMMKIMPGLFAKDA